MSKAYIVVGLAYGDEGKGSWVDHLVRTHGVTQVVRFNGGAQANHNVVTSDGRHHGFAQFAAASFVPGVKTILSKYMLVDPDAMLKEAADLQRNGVDNPLGRSVVSESCPVITPFNQLLNRIQETWRGNARHGSCGMGIGVTQKDVEEQREAALYVGDFASRQGLYEKLATLQKLKCLEAKKFESEATRPLLEQLASVDLTHYAALYEYFHARVRVVEDTYIATLIRTQDTVFEGAQGVLLDQQYGFFPHCSRSNATFENAEQLLRDAFFQGEIERIGLLRGYSTRHGAGPLMTEEVMLPIPHCHNQTNRWQGSFRHGWFDAVTARYALEVVGGVDTLAITNIDRMSALTRVKIATSYEGVDTRYFADERRLRVLREDITTLGSRCERLAMVQPRYLELAGVGETLEQTEAYVERLEAELQHPIAAYSDSIDHRKTYR